MPVDNPSADVDNRQPVPFQFSIRWLLGLPVVVAVVFGTAKCFGLSAYLNSLCYVAYFFGPFTILAAMGMCPTDNRRHERWFGAVAAVSLVTLFLTIVLKGIPVQDWYVSVLVLLLGTGLLWSIQYLFIAYLRTLLERKADDKEAEERANMPRE